MSPVERSAGGGGGTTSPLTTKGDVYTFSNTNARLPVGSDTQVLTANSAATTGNDWEYPPGHEFDYVQVTTGLTVTATSAATAQAWIDGNAVTYDGSTRVSIEVFCCAAQTNANGQELIVELYDGATDLGNMLAISGTNTAFTASIYGAVFTTPSAGAHTFHAKAWKVGAGTNPVLNADVLGPNHFVPAWYRITKA